MDTINVDHRITVKDLTRMKARREPIVMCTAYDFHSARLVDEAGIDSILIGDSMGMTMMGYDSTVPVTLDDILFSTKIVSRTSHHAFVIADMPFMSFQVSYEEGMRNASRLVKEGGAQAVKLEGATDLTLKLTGGLSRAGIPVIAHLGLTPQSINTLGGYFSQGRAKEPALLLVQEAHKVEEAGASAVVLECIPTELAAHITASLSIPTIGIGAGIGCDGQVQVFHDLMGLGTFQPKHAKRYAHVEEIAADALGRFLSETKAGEFPGEEQSTHLASDVAQSIEELRK
ncbi:MAG: 3-methyl-2-oxobutanoate hydroxymethyltransferase [Coriobacteriia bacterium]|nr:3-methyl-2-oxobutanoate hydroxymethyltransferase [Coriobacteriia bacterium]